MGYWERQVIYEKDGTFPNLLLVGKKRFKRQDKVPGCLRCSWEEKRQDNQWKKEGGFMCRCVYVQKKRETDLSVQAKETVWRGREGGREVQARHSIASLCTRAEGLFVPSFPRCRFFSLPSVKSLLYVYIFLPSHAASDILHCPAWATHARI